MESTQKVFYPEGHVFAGEVKEDRECFYILRVGSNKTPPNERFIAMIDTYDPSTTVDSVLEQYVRNASFDGLGDKAKLALQAAKQELQNKNLEMRDEKTGNGVRFATPLTEIVHYELGRRDDEDYASNIIGIELVVSGQGGSNDW